MKWCADGAKLFSTCGKRQYMAIILDMYGRVVGSGYNGGPPKTKHCVDGGCPRFQENSEPNSDYSNCIAIHAEANALLYSDRALRQNGTLYVNGIPCPDCAKQIAGSGLKRVVCLDESGYRPSELTQQLLDAVGITMTVLTRDDTTPIS